MSDQRPRTTLTSAVISLYSAAWLQGLALVSFPASAGVLRELHGLSDAEYGAIFLPQVGLAVIGAFLSGALVTRVGLKGLLVAGLLANALSQLALASLAWLVSDVAYTVLLVGTGLMGFGFGLLGAPLNAYPPMLFERRPQSAIVAVHTLVGVGLSMGPLLAGVFITHRLWVGLPLLLALLLLAVTATTTVAGFPQPAPVQQGVHAVEQHPGRRGTFWLMIAIAFLYAFAEGTFSNWIVVYLHESKHLTAMTAGVALSVFWGALVAGRLTVAVLVTRVPAQHLWLALPVVMAVAFHLLPLASTAALGIGLFALAGLGCSAFFPLTVALATERFPAHTPWVASMLVAALMVGVGLGSFLIGPLRQLLALEQVYQLSSLYPLLALALAGLALRAGRRPANAPVVQPI